MDVIINKIKKLLQLQVLRYILNGLIATIVHYGVLQINIHYFYFTSAAIANMIAAIFGIVASFIGARYYVFLSNCQPIYKQFKKFFAFYIFTTLMHGLLIFIWTDVQNLDYRVGFILATIIQFIISYWGNKLYIFVK